ncbi:hypothetical protein [Paenibacillus naphthalenovorans]|uniref:hypothetical protein n=1 Tax=Paenibacillus naphthalenovorans TaxID=162209 RepID=UPI003D27928E
MQASLDRFAYGLPDPQEQEPPQVAQCTYCSEAIYADDEVTDVEGELFCNDACFRRHVGGCIVRAGDVV